MDHQINTDIRDKEVRLIGDDGSQLGIKPLAEALELAFSQDKDLVKIAPGATPPVCRIMDYGKFRFEQSKKDKEAKKHQHVVGMKEVRLSPGIDVHDFTFKLKNAQRFLEAGDRVKVSIRFRGREMAHTSIGEAQMRKFAEACGVAMERPPKLEGRSMTMFLSPKAKVKE